MTGALHFDVLTLFPELFDGFLTRGMVARARQRNRISVTRTDLRGFTGDPYRSVDDRPYGGGPGMVLKPEPVIRAVDLICGESSDDNQEETTEFVLFDPAGERLVQRDLERYAAEARHIVIACGRYEGFDERILEARPWRRVSIGEFVLSGGEVPAMVLIDGIARLLPDVLGDSESAVRESFSEWAGPGGHDHPQWTRPVEYRGNKVPDVLTSGDHGRIEAWRRAQRAATSETVRNRNESAETDGDRNEP